MAEAAEAVVVEVMVAAAVLVLVTCIEVDRLPKEAQTEPGVAGVHRHHEQNSAYAPLLSGAAEVGAVLHDEVRCEAARAERAPEHREPDPLVRAGGSCYGLGWRLDAGVRTASCWGSIP